uniref:Uncharacterized protein n=1 Tax=Romanomermis culicivorax TaxID=13658 RepID=A0A915JLC3_ROMCU
MIKSKSKPTKRDAILKTNSSPDHIDADTLKTLLGQNSDCDYNINGEALRLLAQDVNYRLRYVVQLFFADICYPNRPKKDILPSDSSLLEKYQCAYQEIIDLPEEDFYVGHFNSSFLQMPTACLSKLQKISRDHQPIFLDLAIKSIFNNDNEQETLLKILFSLQSILNCRYTNYNKVTQILQDNDNLVNQLTEICLTRDESCSEASARILLNLANNSFFGLRDNVCSTIINHSISILNDFANHNFDRYDRVLNILQIFIDYLDIYQVLDSFLAHFGENSWAFLSDYDSFEYFDVHLLNYTLHWTHLLNHLLRKNSSIMDVVLFSKIAYFLSFVFGENFSNFFHDKVAKFTTSTVTMDTYLPRTKTMRQNQNSENRTASEHSCVQKKFFPVEDVFDEYTTIISRKPSVTCFEISQLRKGVCTFK